MKNKLINKKPLGLALIAVSALAALPASANTYTYNDSTAVTEGGTLTGVNNLVIPEYNGNVADLVSVEITITLSVPSFDLIVDNDTDQVATGDVSFGTIGSVLYSIAGASTFDGTDTINGSYFNITTQTSSFSTAANDTDADTGFDNDAGPDNHLYSTTSVTVGQVTTRFMDASTFAGWTGAGNVTFDLAADFVSDLNVDPGGGSGVVRFQGVIPGATYSVQVRYIDTIPEPTAAVLGGLGLLGLLRRRR